MKTQDFFKTTEKVVVENYPYGFRLRCTKFYSLEFVSGKGFRYVEQTTNPKNADKLNKEKKGTYDAVKLMFREAETGHIKYYSLDFYGADGINKDCQFMAEHFDLFTPEQIKFIYGYLHMKLKVEVYSYVQWCGAKVENIAPLVKSFLSIAKQGRETGENVFASIVLDIPAMEATKMSDFSPFVESEPIRIV